MRRWGVLLLVGVFSLGVAQSWSRDAVDSLMREGIVYGYPSGEIKPEAYAKRGEVFTLLWRVILTYRLKDLQSLTKEDIERLKGLLATVEELSRALRDQGQVLSAYSDAIKELRQDLEKAQAYANTLAGEAGKKAEEALAQVSTWVERLSALEATTYKGLRDFREEVNTLTGALKDLDAKVKSLEEALSGKTGELSTRFSEFQGMLSRLEGAVSKAEAEIGGVKGALAELEEIKLRVNTLEAQVKALREEVVRLKAEMPKKEAVPPFGVQVSLSGVSPLTGMARVGYALSEGFGVYLRGAYDLGFYGAVGAVNVRPVSPFVLTTSLGVGRGFYGPGFTYGEIGVGFGGKLFGDLGLGVEGVLSFPLGTGPSVARFGVGVIYGW
ncbi:MULTISPECIES: S-layer homology domain-containing protein [Thermus]|uniref:S-layer homology domain-containing protein n=1 Tax=Thermus brockianus TaxID=56956 RepID=UPI0022781300|nr:S-layer homology domain-containing protein [Thermus brockianus]